MRSRSRRTSWKRAVAGMAVVCVGLTSSLVTAAPQVGATAPGGLRSGGSVDEAWLTGRRARGLDHPAAGRLAGGRTRPIRAPPTRWGR